MSEETRGTVAVVGLGKIGLPLAAQYARRGYRVIGCDRDARVVEAVAAGRAHVEGEPGLAEAVVEAVGRGQLSATLDTAAAARGAQVVVVIVPVGIDGRRAVEYGALDAATAAIGEGLRRGTLVIYESTVPVGTTAGRARARLEETARMTAGQDFLLAYSPERVSSGSIFRDLRAYPKIVGGIDEASGVAAAAFYRSALGAEVIRLASTEEAEFVKLIETTYRDVNIALANEFARCADAYGLDAAAAIAAANTQPYAHIHAPGVGVGGHCIPVYPYFLLAGAQEPGELTLPRAARRVNDGMAEYAARRLERALGTLAGVGALIVGVAYRGDVRETAHSSAKRLQDALQARGARVYAEDPLFDAEQLRALGYTPLAAGEEGEIGALVVQALSRSRGSCDFGRFPACRALLDGRGVVDRGEIEALGMRYLAIGDGGAS